MTIVNLGYNSPEDGQQFGRPLVKMKFNPHFVWPHLTTNWVQLIFQLGHILETPAWQLPSQVSKTQKKLSMILQFLQLSIAFWTAVLIKQTCVPESVIFNSLEFKTGEFTLDMEYNFYFDFCPFILLKESLRLAIIFLFNYFLIWAFHRYPLDNC